MKQVYQELIFPKNLTPSEYFEPYSAQNTSGDTRKAYALFQLVDPINNFETKYSPSAASFSQTYKYLLNRINTNGRAEIIFADALEKINIAKFCALGPNTQGFYLIETNPYNLFETEGMDISFTVGPSDSDADFIEINSKEKRQITFYGFSAHIIRPWFSQKIFGMKPWTIRNCSVGAYSDGTYLNKGVLPLLPIELLISINKNGERYLQAIINDILPQTPMSEKVLKPADADSFLSVHNSNNIVNDISNQNQKNLIKKITSLQEPLLVNEYGEPVK